MQLVSLQGTVLLQTEITDPTTSVELDNIMAGTYLVVVKDAKTIKTVKLIVD
ncbi:MAG: T9SS type A sorting domain-containing protein [Bacteroidales bacterium]